MAPQFLTAPACGSNAPTYSAGGTTLSTWDIVPVTAPAITPQAPFTPIIPNGNYYISSNGRGSCEKFLSSATGGTPCPAGVTNDIVNAATGIISESNEYYLSSPLSFLAFPHWQSCPCFFKCCSEPVLSMLHEMKSAVAASFTVSSGFILSWQLNKHALLCSLVVEGLTSDSYCSIHLLFCRDPYHPYILGQQHPAQHLQLQSRWKRSMPCISLMYRVWTRRCGFVLCGTPMPLSLYSTCLSIKNQVWYVGDKINPYLTMVFGTDSCVYLFCLQGLKIRHFVILNQLKHSCRMTAQADSKYELQITPAAATACRFPKEDLPATLLLQARLAGLQRP